MHVRNVKLYMDPAGYNDAEVFTSRVKRLTLCIGVSRTESSKPVLSPSKAGTGADSVTLKKQAVEIPRDRNRKRGCTALGTLDSRSFLPQSSLTLFSRGNDPFRWSRSKRSINRCPAISGYLQHRAAWRPLYLLSIPNHCPRFARIHVLTWSNRYNLRTWSWTL